jgi:hypothetical protein
LIEPSPERFLRLVTQLKWRLLEGGGQAYYELGVADSGQLVGLTRQNLERSLETLEAMAGEIGASVVVVKEIEVPPSLFEPANSNVMLPKSKGANSHSRGKGTERVGKAYRSRPSDWGAVEIIRNTSTTVVSDETFGLNDTAIDSEGLKEEVCLTVRVSPHPVFSDLTPVDRTPSPSSPIDDGIFPFDAELHLFSTGPTISDHSARHSHMPYTKRSIKENRNGSALPRHLNESVYTPPSPVTPSSALEATNISLSPSFPASESDQLAKDLSTLHTSLASTPPNGHTSHLSPNIKKDGKVIGLGIQLATTAYKEAISEPRLIVEALVVRKLSADEAFLDFGGFTLAD